jgi:flavin-dependent dehydrogenase
MPDSAPGTGHYDLVIIGGGPAGTATALALQRLDGRLRTAIVERSDYSALRIGETLPPPARNLLAALGVWEAFTATSPIKSFGTRASWGSPKPYENEFIFSPHGDGWHVDRNTFDALLAAEALRAGVEVITNTVVRSHQRHDAKWLLTIRSLSGAARDISANFVVDATGRQAWFSTRQGSRHIVEDHLAAASVFFRLDADNALVDTYTTVEACEHGWWYSATLPGQRMAAAFITDAGELRRLGWRTLDKWISLTSMAPHTAARLAGAVPLGPPALHPACSRRLELPVGDGWLAAGDAASTFDPLTSQGVVKALRCGIYAARAVVRHFRRDARALDDYAAHLAREYNNYSDARAAYYRLESRWPDSPFWLTRRREITLDPREMLRSQEGVHAGVRLTGKASRPQQLLAEICERPRTAADAVREFHSRTGHTHTDRQVVLALQDLVARGVLLTEPA